MKTLKEIALFLRSNIVEDIPNTFDINVRLIGDSNGADILKGVNDFQSLLYRFIDTAIENADNTTTQSEVEKTTIAFEKSFPSLIHPLYLLYCIGLHGRLDNASKCLFIDGNELSIAFKEIHGSKPNQCFLFLADLGFAFLDIDIKDISYKLNKAGLIEIRYPNSNYTLVGLKAMADATALMGKGHKDKGAIASIFMRCDYHALALPKKFSPQLIDCIGSLQDEYKSFLVSIHEFLLNQNCKCDSKYQMNEFVFTYTSKVFKTVVFSARISMDGAYIKLNSKLINEQSNLLSQAPENILEAVKNSWNCAKLNDPNACNPKCTNLRFSIDGKEYQKCRCLNFNLPINTKQDREYIMTWLDKELSMS